MTELTNEEFKQICIGILEKFDSICKEHNLRYSLAFGTLLGAVRHGGFIPWDDDIDVCMPREDYEKLLSLQYEDENFKILDYKHSKNYYYVFAKMIDKNTTLIEDSRAETDMGVYIDIFQCDYVSEENSEKNYKTAARGKAIIDHLGSSIGFNRSLSLKYILKLLFRAAAAPFRKAIIAHYDKSAASIPESRHMSAIVYPVYKKYTDSRLFENLKPISFEGKEFMAFEDYDCYLKSIYNDYMTLPPVEQRISHHSFKAYK